MQDKSTPRPLVSAPLSPWPHACTSHPLEFTQGTTENQLVRRIDEDTHISRMHALQIHSWTAGQAHQPRITAKARLRRARTLVELHDGGRSRRERALVRPSAWPSSIK